MVFEATCTAPVNIAVVKYWGKRSTALILPTNSSLSVTLSQDHLRSLTTARVIEAGGTQDRLWLNGTEEEIKAGGRMATCLKEMRSLRKAIEDAHPSLPSISFYPLHIASENNFPTAAGLASSASGLSALIATLSSLYSLASYSVTPSHLSRIARQGSGSACRSMFGGFVAWEMGTLEDGSDSCAVEIAPKEGWSEMQALILVVSDAKKGTASSDGMQRTVATSPLLQHRIRHVVPQRMERMIRAIGDKDFTTFAEETMRDSNSFHAVCLDTDPPIFYLNDVSRGIIGVVNEINRVSVVEGKGLIAAYTYDAGPNAVIYVLKDNAKYVLEILLRFFPQQSFDDVLAVSPRVGGAQHLPAGFNASVSGGVFELGSVVRIIHTEVGDGPRVLNEESSLLAENGLPKLIK